MYVYCEEKSCFLTCAFVRITACGILIGDKCGFKKINRAQEEKRNRNC